jgi:hypothetical protein
VFAVGLIDEATVLDAGTGGGATVVAHGCMVAFWTCEGDGEEDGRVVLVSDGFELADAPAISLLTGLWL